MIIEASRLVTPEEFEYLSFASFVCEKDGTVVRPKVIDEESFQVAIPIVTLDAGVVDYRICDEFTGKEYRASNKELYWQKGHEP